MALIFDTAIYAPKWIYARNMPKNFIKKKSANENIALYFAVNCALFMQNFW